MIKILKESTNLDDNYEKIKKDVAELMESKIDLIVQKLNKISDALVLDVIKSLVGSEYIDNKGNLRDVEDMYEEDVPELEKTLKGINKTAIESEIDDVLSDYLSDNIL